MARTAPKTIEPPAMTEPQIIARLEDWRERLTEHKTGNTNCVLTLTEIRAELDRLLDDLSWLIKGRKIT